MSTAYFATLLILSCPGGQELLQQMRGWDRALFDGCLLQLQVLEPVNSRQPKQGSVAWGKVILAQQSGSSWYFEKADPDVGPPTYAEDLEHVWSYDGDGNLLKTLPTRTSLVFGIDRLTCLDERSLYTIAKDSTLAAVEPMLPVRIIDTSFSRPTPFVPPPMLQPFALVTGRGFGYLIDEVLETEYQPNGTCMLVCSGRYRSQSGSWRILVDTSVGCLVRTASFFGANEGRNCEIRTFGELVVDAGVLARTGSVYTGDGTSILDAGIDNWRQSTADDLDSIAHRVLTSPPTPRKDLFAKERRVVRVD